MFLEAEFAPSNKNNQNLKNLKNTPFMMLGSFIFMSGILCNNIHNMCPDDYQFKAENYSSEAFYKISGTTNDEKINTVALKLLHTLVISNETNVIYRLRIFFDGMVCAMAGFRNCAVIEDHLLIQNADFLRQLIFKISRMSKNIFKRTAELSKKMKPCKNLPEERIQKSLNYIEDAKVLFNNRIRILALHYKVLEKKRDKEYKAKNEHTATI